MGSRLSSDGFRGKPRNEILRIDILEAFEDEPKELDHVLPGFIAGTVGALYAHGGAGKSYLALEAAMAVACNTEKGDLLELGLTKHGEVLFFSVEDPEIVIQHRLHSIGKMLPVAARVEIAENLAIEARAGSSLDLMSEETMKMLLTEGEKKRLIVIDTLSRAHRKDENSNQEMVGVIGSLESIAAKTGAAILFLHHVRKGSTSSGSGDGQHAARGASALTDQSRWAASLSGMTKQEAGQLRVVGASQAIGEAQMGFYVKFSLPKNNYGKPVADRWFKRFEGGVLRPVEIEKITSQRGKGTKEPVSKKGTAREDPFNRGVQF